ncbi:MAG TPA: hypothetical protein VME69_13565 [Methylocella sp.]|nr:hypothetical protein [Methylocella sp.]
MRQPSLVVLSDRANDSSMVREPHLGASKERITAARPDPHDMSPGPSKGQRGSASALRSDL